MSWHVHLDSFAALLPGIPTATYPEGEPFRTALATGTMSVELFAPKGPDRQQPHDQDELYVIGGGTAVFERDGEEVRVSPGSVLFVPAGMTHRFRDQSDDFTTWVVFWGASGGERGDTVGSPFGIVVVPPVTLRTDTFVLEPLAPRHHERDFAAWSSSIEHIRSTPGFAPHDGEGETWPYEMAPEANLADLQQHADEFAGGDAFAYSVLDHAGEVIGCVYIDPDPTGEANAVCRLWVRASHAELDGELYAALSAWLAGESWPFDFVRFPGR